MVSIQTSTINMTYAVYTMRMSLVCPRGWPPGLQHQGDMPANTRGWDGFFATGLGDLQAIVSESMNWGR